MRYSQYSRFEKKENLIICANVNNGQWFRMSLECYEIMEMLLSSEKTVEEFLELVEDLDDREYLRKTFEHLEKIGILEKEEEKSVPSSIGFSITHRCNLNCRHCSYSAGTILEQERVSDEKIIEILYKIIELNPKNLSITGGEPLVRKNFKEICYILQKDYQGICNLMTNGIHINKDNIKIIKDTFEYFDISIDGINEESCSKIRGKGVFKKTMEAVKLLIQEGVKPEKISLSMVLTSENEKLVDEFEKLNKELGTNSVTRAYAFIGRGKDSNLFYTDLKQAKEIVVDSNLHNISCMNCGAIKNSIYIDCDGNVYPCAMMIEPKLSMCNILKVDNIKNYFFEKEYKKSQGYENFMTTFMPEYNEKCKNCEYKFFCIKCPIQHYQYTSQDFHSCFCEIQKKKYRKIMER